MPLVRITLAQGRDAAGRRALADGVHRALVATANVPEDDRFQVIDEVPAESLVFSPGYLGIDRRGPVVFVQVFLLPGLERPFAHYTHRAQHRQMAAVAARTPELPWRDLLDDFRATGADPRHFTIDGLHPNRMGAAVLAEILHRVLAESGLP